MAKAKATPEINSGAVDSAEKLVTILASMDAQLKELRLEVAQLRNAPTTVSAKPSTKVETKSATATAKVVEAGKIVDKVTKKAFSELREKAEASNSATLIALDGEKCVGWAIYDTGKDGSKPSFTEKHVKLGHTVIRKPD